MIRKVFIVGWYGTETLGDKAILGGILESYRRQYERVNFTIASNFPFVTRRTLQELDESIDVLPAYSIAFLRQAALADEVVIGGGPLMDAEELSIHLWAFSVARFFGRKRVVFGCSVGPLKSLRYRTTVHRILQLATDIRLRDRQSVAYTQELIGCQNVEFVPDPAVGYVTKRSQALLAQGAVTETNSLACFLRDWPREYAGNLSDEIYLDTKTRFEACLAKCLQAVCDEYNLQLVLYPMHSFVVGGDDRIFYRHFVQQYFAGWDRVHYEFKPGSVDGVLKAMLGARACVSMRFHSAVFAHTMMRPFVAIDYTSGGKIHGFMQDVQAMQDYVALLDMAAGKIDTFMSRLDAHLQKPA